MKLHDLLGVTGFGLLIAATYIKWGIAPSLAVAGGGLLLAGLLLARAKAHTGGR